MLSIVTPKNIAECWTFIRPYLRRTPVVEINAIDFGLQPNVLALKLELLQHSGSFKSRGAFANLVMRQAPPAGVVAASGGNHGAAVAFRSIEDERACKDLRADYFVAGKGAAHS